MNNAASSFGGTLDEETKATFARAVDIARTTTRRAGSAPRAPRGTGLDGTPVFAVAAGTVHFEGGRSLSVVSGVSRRTFGYWHVVPGVKHRREVSAADAHGNSARAGLPFTLANRIR